MNILKVLIRLVISETDIIMVVTKIIVAKSSFDGLDFIPGVCNFIDAQNYRNSIIT